LEFWPFLAIGILAIDPFKIAQFFDPCMDYTPDNWGNFANKPAEPVQHTRQPIVTGTSVLGIRYKDGIMMLADTLASYGSLAQIRDMKRLAAFGNIVIGASGDMSDWQEIQHVLTRLLYFELKQHEGICS
jgi:20S proteasome alpha/beta subunit